MKESTIEKIIENSYWYQMTYIGKYAYQVQWNPMAGTNYIVRCKRSELNKQWIDHEGNYRNGWQWLFPVDRI